MKKQKKDKPKVEVLGEDMQLFEVTIEPKETKHLIVAHNLAHLHEIIEDEDFKLHIDEDNHFIPPLNVKWKGSVLVDGWTLRIIEHIFSFINER